MMVALSFACLKFVTTQVDRKAPKNSFTEREYEQYEKETGLKRRSKLIPFDKNEQYRFFAVPFAHTKSSAVDAAKKLLGEDRQVKVIDPEELIAKEKEDEGRYSFLLLELESQGRLMPLGLLTALVKQEVKLFMNTTKGQHDSNIILVNYPQSTDEAIKFENDVSDIHKCLVSPADNQANLRLDLGDEGLRKVEHVIGYFDTVDKVQNM